MTRPFLEVDGLVVDYPAPRGTFRAVDDVSFSIHRGETLGVVGESGCGKSTIAKSVVRLITPSAGRIVLDGTDIASMKERQLRRLRSSLQMIFQDPYGSLDPHLCAQDIVAEPLRLGGMDSRADREAEAARLIEQVGLPRSALQRRPSEFSGGQRQRIGIARALASRPELLVCDEVTSALDVSVQAQVLDLLQRIQAESNLTYMIISHNLGVVRQLCQNVVVMSKGRLVESGPTSEVLSTPRKAITRALRRAALDPTTMRGRKPRAVVLGVSSVEEAVTAGPEGAPLPVGGS